jgi:hypothetical protein
MRRDISIIRLYVLRATYLLVAVGLGVQIWIAKRVSRRAGAP